MFALNRPIDTNGFTEKYDHIPNEKPSSNGKHATTQTIDPDDERMRVPIKLSYNMNHKRRGLALIFNHYAFDHSLRLGLRNGTHKDFDSLKSTFESLGFKVQAYQDLHLNQIHQELKKG